MSSSRKNRRLVAAVIVAAMATFSAVIMYIVHVDTVTALRHREEENEAVQAILDSDDFGLAVLNQDQKILEWNPAMERMSGWTKEELIRRNQGLRPVMAEELWISHTAAFKSRLTEDTPKVSIVRCEMRLKDKPQPTLKVRVTVRVIRGSHGNTYAVAHIDPVDLVERL